jgi:arylsulfatase
VKGFSQLPIEGISVAETFLSPDAETGKQTQFYSMLGTRAIWHQGWKASAVSSAAPQSWPSFAGQRWELYDTENDPSECHDLATEYPDKLEELVSLWWHEAGRYGALPLETRNAVEILGAERPQLAKARNRYVYYPGGSEIPESVAPNIRNRSYTVAVEVTIDTEEASGVLFAQGSRFGGHALYIKGRKLKYVYNFAGINEQIIESSADVPTGHVVLSASFEREGDTMPAEGTLTIHIRDEAVGEGKITTQPGKFSLAGEGLNVGKEGAEAVTDDYPGDRPWAFVGGTIHKAIIDVSGEPFIDLAEEARMAFARD